ncbi:MAG: 16S rRNA processing protein RimM [Chloroflexi bacterium]|nr:16S rRNA processing protein RimM [Chloroflexota bacterium]
MTGSHDRSEHSVPEPPDIEDLVVVGRVRRPTGIDGTLLIEVYSGDPKRFSVGDRVFIDGSEHEIVRTGASGKSAKIKLAGIDSIEKAGPFRGEELAVTIDSLPDNPPGVYYHYEILGIDVVTLDGQRLGTLTEVIETGSNDVFVVSPDGDETRREAANEDSGKGPNNSGEILIPVLDGVIVAVDKENGVMTIDPPAGLI